METVLIIAGALGGAALIAAVGYMFLKHSLPPVSALKGAKEGSPHPVPRPGIKSAAPCCVPETDPARLNFNCEKQESALLDVCFEGPYTAREGVTTFRGDNFRSGASWGNADIRLKKFDGRVWTVRTGRLKKTNGRGKYWTGSGWTGQPVLVRWTEGERAEMNLYPDKKTKDGLVEVIYATMDGRVYFLDYEDGSATRPPVTLGMPIKGTGSLHPTMPVFIAGAGDSMDKMCARSFIIDLKKGEIACEYGYDDAFAPRLDHNRFHGFDSSPLFDIRNNLIFQPAENGIIYISRLLSGEEIKPEIISRWRYTNSRSGDKRFWLGMESSAVMWKNYMYIADNGGNLMCIDVNDMRLVWSCDTLDDTNASPVLEEDGDNAYIYIGTSLHFTKDENGRGNAPVWKIDARTGEKLWQHDFLCATMEGVSGGVQATALVGRGELSELVYFAVARTGGFSKGVLIALEKSSGAQRWAAELNYYPWASPLALYDGDAGYIIQCESNGDMLLLDGLTGRLYDTINLGGNIEASPAAFGNTVVVGTRKQKICGVRVR